MMIERQTMEGITQEMIETAHKLVAADKHKQLRWEAALGMAIEMKKLSMPRVMPNIEQAFMAMPDEYEKRDAK